MFERIIQIIVYVLNSLKDNQNIESIDIKELTKLGYSEVEISTAISWLVDKADFEKIENIFDFEKSNNGIRVLHASEMALFTKDAMGELIQLHSLKVINNEQIEMILEKAMFSGIQKIDILTLRQIVAGMIFNVANNLEANNRLMLFGNESVN